MAKILVVDDSAFTRNTLSMFMQNGGHEVVGLAENADQALELYKTLHPELVTLDYLMPDKTGEVVLREIIQHDPEARVIMISGSGDSQLEERALQTGAKVFIEKPCEKKDILTAIDQVMNA
jgi:two-component system chemotaxis response regulator CheY